MTQALDLFIDPAADQQYRDNFPDVHWDEPIPITMGGKGGWVCRYCVAKHGIGGSETHRLFTTKRAAQAHVDEHTP
jgi:hypothetical protein